MQQKDYLQLLNKLLIYHCMSMFSVNMKLYLPQEKPIVDANIYCLMIRTQFSNTFYYTLTIISPVLIRIQYFLIIFIPAIYNHLLSRK